ncbi:hypothetical protein K227x_63290 [Rubripirellula lacrimiformis]|uniref:Uncharacterized protein n=1 Tax=Rubripirellula lacrimiformis TaxID=1930273 RepID=A0A517NL94_9BACT|nr:hypothetical protein [Rubripirellula lacrimiformis]QDT07900.1 hypothetical protein K227x_63290 [Rubripirellula lacrimiformis]
MTATPANQPARIRLDVPGGRIRVEFRWEGDRFVHRIWVDDIESCHSIDGDADTDWPPSPPIQQLSLEDINGAPVILGVGAAGRGHWSISVESEADGNALKFDLACRYRDEANSLGSAYQTDDRAQVTALTGSLNTMGPDEGTTDNGADDKKRPTVRVVPEDTVANGSGAGTQRWVYRIEAN